MKVDTPLSTLRLAILGILASKPGSGYDLRKVFETTPMGHFSSSPGAIYPALRRLQEDGLIAGEVERGGTLRPRLVYSLTAAGSEALEQQLTQPVTRDDVVWGFDHVILRFAFMDHLERPQVLRFLDQLRDSAEAYAAHLVALGEEMRSLMSPVGRLALEHGIQAYRGSAQWARAAIAELSSNEHREEGGQS